MQGEIFEKSDSNSTESASTLSPTVLVVDDDLVILNLLQTALSIQGYRVVAMSDAREALANFQLGDRQYDLVIMDQTMPYLTGMELAKHLRNHRPDIKMILMSGYGESLELPQLDEDYRFLSKPFTLPQIFEVVKDLTV